MGVPRVGFAPVSWGESYGCQEDGLGCIFILGRLMMLVIGSDRVLVESACARVDLRLNVFRLEIESKSNTFFILCVSPSF